MMFEEKKFRDVKVISKETRQLVFEVLKWKGYTKKQVNNMTSTQVWRLFKKYCPMDFTHGFESIFEFLDQKERELNRLEEWLKKKQKKSKVVRRREWLSFG